MALEIHRSARKHGITDAAITHVVEHAMTVVEKPDGQTLYLGPDPSGNLLEVVTMPRANGTSLAIHAVKIRRSYRTWLPGGETDGR